MTTIKLNEISEVVVVNSYVLKESIGGDLPELRLNISTTNTDLFKDLEELSGSIIHKDIEISFNGFIESCSIRINNVELSVVSVPKDYYTLNKVNEYNSIDDLLAIYGSVMNDSSEVVVSNDFKIYQNNITDYQLLLKYAKSYNTDVVYSLRFDGVKLTNVLNNTDNEVLIHDYDSLGTVNTTRLKSDYYESVVCKSTKNKLSTITKNNEYLVIKEDYNILIETELHNSKYYNKESSTLRLPYYIPYSAGDLVTNKKNKFLITQSLYVGNTNEHYQEITYVCI